MPEDGALVPGPAPGAGTEPAGTEAAGDRLSWEVLLASVTGAAHEAAGRPLEDAVACHGDTAGPPGVLAVAVADGHGHPRHSRSARGSALAVELTGPAVFDHAGRLLAASSAPDVVAAAQRELIPDLIGRWRAAVAADVDSDPIDPAEQRWLRPGDDESVLYGSTLLFAVVAFPWLALCQIGDGDILAVGPDGQAELPVPGDDRLDGRRTTSLCQVDALASFRCAAVDLRAHPLAAILLATDGFGNAQAEPGWTQPVGASLAAYLREHGVSGARERLRAWAAQCASAEGSGDDTTLALLLPGEEPRQQT